MLATDKYLKARQAENGFSQGEAVVENGVSLVEVVVKAIP